MSRMRRVVPLLIAVVAALAPASAAFASGADVIRDCTLDGKLDKSYTQKELRQALASIPSDVDEYTDCRDVIRAAQLAAATGASSGGGSGGSSSSGGTSTGGGGDGGTTGGGGTSSGSGSASADNGTGGTSSSPGAFGGFSDVPTDPASSASPSERSAIAQARDEVANADPVAQAGVGVPAPLIGALAIGGLALLVFVVFDLRRRLVDRRSA